MARYEHGNWKIPNPILQAIPPRTIDPKQLRSLWLYFLEDLLEALLECPFEPKRNCPKAEAQAWLETPLASTVFTFLNQELKLETLLKEDKCIHYSHNQKLVIFLQGTPKAP